MLECYPRESLSTALEVEIIDNDSHFPVGGFFEKIQDFGEIDSAHCFRRCYNKNVEYMDSYTGKRLEEPVMKEQEKNLIRQKLGAMADEKYKEFHSRLVPGEEGILGVRVPKLRAFARELAKGDWRAYLETATEDSYEEIMLQGFVIGYAKMDLEEAYERIADFVPKIHNWAVCDCVCSTLKIVKKDLDRTWEFLQPYLQDDREYFIRFGVIMLLDYYKKSPEYLPEILEILDGIHHEGYYVKMAVAWTLSMYYVEYPSQVMEYFSHHHLDEFTYQKALQKIIESRQITEETRAQIREMKRRK